MLKIKSIFYNIRYMFKAMWSFSKTLFVGKFFLAVLNGIMAPINAYILKILIENAQPSPNPKASEALSKVVESAKLGKNNPAIVKVLLKVVIDDIAYEISCTQDYVDYLEENIKRFKQINKYLDKMNSAKKDSQREYFKQYAEMYFEKGETFDNIAEIEQEYINAFNVRKAKVDNLYNEIKIIKKLKV